MHGRPRQAPTAATPEELAKIQQYNKHKTAALTAYKNKVFTPQTLVLTSAILALNPDLNTLYNFRKEQVFDLLFKQPQWPDLAQQKAIFQTELELSTTSLKKNPKSYHAWYHRIWCIEHGKGAIDLASEIALTDKFFSMDARNFHCWNYRRYIARILLGLPSPYSEDNKSSAEIDNEVKVIKYFSTLHGKFQDEEKSIPYSSLEHFAIPFGQTGTKTSLITVESELLFTQRMVEQDFSNYSAWHYRSLLLPVVILRKFIQQPLHLDKSIDQQSQLAALQSFYGVSPAQNQPNAASFLHYDPAIPPTTQAILNISTKQPPSQFATPLAAGMHLNSLSQQLLEQVMSTASEQVLTQPQLSIEQLQPHTINIQQWFLQLMQYWSSIILFYIQFDFSYINMAVTITPNDQSPWLYQRWLLSLTQQLTHSFLSSQPGSELNAANTTENEFVNSLVMSNFIPNSDNNLHYTDLLTTPSLVTMNLKETAQPQLQYSFLTPLSTILSTIITNTAHPTDTNNKTFTSQLDLLRTLTSVQDSPSTDVALTIPAIVKKNQKITLSTFLFNFSSTLTTLLTKLTPSLNPRTAQFYMVVLPLQAVQLRLLHGQYQFLTTDLFDLLSDQPQSLRQPLLGVVILRLCLSSLFVTHNRLNALFKGKDDKDSQPGQSRLEYFTTIDQINTHNVTTVERLISAPIPATTTITQTIEHLSVLDSDRVEYYKALQKTLANVEKQL